MGAIVSRRTSKIKKDKKKKKNYFSSNSSAYKINFITLTKKEVEENRSSAYSYVL
jgi:hypothetical protein